MFHITAVALLFASTASAEDLTECRVMSGLRHAFVGYTTLHFTTPEGLANEEASKAKLEIRKPGPTAKGGSVEVVAKRLQKKKAAPDGQLVVVVDAEGRELLRASPAPAEPTPYDPYYWGKGTLFIDRVGKLPLVISVVDVAEQARCDWTVTADGEVTVHREEKEKKKIPPPPKPTVNPKSRDDGRR